MLITRLRTIAAIRLQYLSCRHKYGHHIGDDKWEKSVSLLAGGAATFRMQLTNKCHLLSDRSGGLRWYSIGWLSSCPYCYDRRDFARIALCDYVYIIVVINGVDLYFNTLRTGLLNCLNARSRGLNFRNRAFCI